MNDGIILSETMREALPLVAGCMMVVVALAFAMVAGVKALDWYRALRQGSRSAPARVSARSRD